jgi:hypothetical protein
MPIHSDHPVKSAAGRANRDLFVFVRENGRWWAVADQFSP